MKIASAQINSTVGHIQSNLEEHYSLIETAITEGVELIAFPEMSITGYCREEGKQLALTENDPRLDQLKQLATKGNIHIIAGAPILIKDKLYIGAFVIYPNKLIAIYTKQYLHDGEELYYASSKDFNPIIQLGQEKISLAICADINNQDHPRASSKNGSTIYIPCIFYSKEGMDKGKEQLGAYSKDYSLNILMSNYTGELWNMEAAGQSAFWTSDGNLCGQLDSSESGLLIAEKSGEEWTTKKQAVRNG
jgi:predicted amidohydrolase